LPSHFDAEFGGNKVQWHYGLVCIWVFSCGKRFAKWGITQKRQTITVSRFR